MHELFCYALDHPNLDKQKEILRECYLVVSLSEPDDPDDGWQSADEADEDDVYCPRDFMDVLHEYNKPYPQELSDDEDEATLELNINLVMANEKKEENAPPDDRSIDLEILSDDKEEMTTTTANKAMKQNNNDRKNNSTIQSKISRTTTRDQKQPDRSDNKTNDGLTKDINVEQFLQQWTVSPPQEYEQQNYYSVLEDDDSSLESLDTFDHDLTNDTIISDDDNKASNDTKTTNAPNEEEFENVITHNHCNYQSNKNTRKRLHYKKVPCQTEIIEAPNYTTTLEKSCERHRLQALSSTMNILLNEIELYLAAHTVTNTLCFQYWKRRKIRKCKNTGRDVDIAERT